MDASERRRLPVAQAIDVAQCLADEVRDTRARSEELREEARRTVRSAHAAIDASRTLMRDVTRAKGPAV